MHSLMPYLVDLPHLVAAARLCMRRAGAPGADGVTWAGYRSGLRPRLAELSDRLRTGTWEPGPLRHVEITSYTGKVFPAVIPTVEDRIVHRAMRRAVEPIIEHHVLADWVSAYRPRRNRITALRQAEQHLAAGRQWVADVDVAGASAGGSSDQFVDWLAVHVADGSFLRLFRRIVGALPTPLVPGSGLWPVLFHLRLSQVDAMLTGWPVVRFADNYLIFATDQARAVAAFDALTAALASWQMQPHPRKSRVRPPHQANAEDLFLIDG
ncbi:reverse transcriptase domain-containing protein [Micromonospora lupini]|uniref:Putative RNA-directed DNA polymerase (Reverse transcriptase) n=1 Tax=Micromonospora lupini str. Lupac 08 TaxID=1150864 RepID=I0L1T9_9ACTN|nr:reverse transcriptase domain-containing protein [Micromonospora lupini]CCH17786.1 Putative RNA-directed DNA polymerase (Reverse transcriptase) [Micromonospora lupini str. Lupac 08]